MSLVLASMLATSQVLPFIDRSELRTMAVSEGQVSPGSEVASAPVLHRTKSSAALCSVAEGHAVRNGFMVGSGDGHLLSSRTMAVLKLTCVGERVKPAQTPIAIFAAR